MQNVQPEISVIIPIYHSSQLVADTCESLIAQQGVRWEAIFIDAGVELHASEIIKSYQDSRIRVQALTKGSLYALMNRGLLMAQGEYVNLLLEGCAYLAPTSLERALKSIKEHNNPDLFYTASYIGDASGTRHLFYVDDWEDALKRGLQPTLLQSCFFKTTIFKKIGYFNQNLDRRGAFDFFCRAHKAAEVCVKSEMRVYVEMNRFPSMLLSPWAIVSETYQVLLCYFGISHALKWLFSMRIKALFGGRYLLDSVIPERR